MPDPTNWLRRDPPGISRHQIAPTPIDEEPINWTQFLVSLIAVLCAAVLLSAVICGGIWIFIKAWRLIS